MILFFNILCQLYKRLAVGTYGAVFRTHIDGIGLVGDDVGVKDLYQLWGIFGHKSYASGKYIIYFVSSQFLGRSNNGVGDAETAVGRLCVYALGNINIGQSGVGVAYSGYIQPHQFAFEF